jgi:hypothetical protein
MFLSFHAGVLNFIASRDTNCLIQEAALTTLMPIGAHQDYPMFVAAVDDLVVVLCRSNPSLSPSAARETGRLLIQASDRVAIDSAAREAANFG